MKVKLKSQIEFKKMVRAKQIKHLHTSDDGERSSFGTIGNPSHVFGFWYDDYGQEYMVVDHPNPISKESYEQRNIFFEEIVDPPTEGKDGIGWDPRGIDDDPSEDTWRK